MRSPKRLLFCDRFCNGRSRRAFSRRNRRHGSQSRFTARDQLAVETLEARYLLSGQSPVANDDFYEVAAGSTLEAVRTQAFSLTPSQIAWDVDGVGNGHVYERVADSLTWEQAREAAGQRMLGDAQGHLVTITSRAELDFLAANFTDDRTWIGAYQDTAAPDYSEPHGGWRWVTGEAWEFTNWSSSEPNDSGPEDFVEWGHRPRVE